MEKLRELEEEHLKRIECELEKDPQNIQCWIEKGVLFFEHFHLHEEAIDCLETALKYAPKNVDALFWLAVCYYFDFLDYEKAKKNLVRALELAPERPDCLSLLASVVGDQEGNIQKAIDLTRKVIAQAPTWPTPYHELARLLLEQGKIEEAEKTAQEGLKYRNQYSEFANSIERYFERVITGRASSCGDFGWNYLLADIEEAKKQRNSFR
jgi:tetratricopeptide (TPR) repeat protein